MYETNKTDFWQMLLNNKSTSLKENNKQQKLQSKYRLFIYINTNFSYNAKGFPL